MKPIQSKIRDRAQEVAEKIRPLLWNQPDYTIKLKNSTLWMRNFHGVGFVAWRLDAPEGFADCRTVYPLVRHIYSGVDMIPLEEDLRQFIDAVQELDLDSTP